MPSFSELKAKAVKVKDAGIEKAQNVRDRNSSVPMKKTNWDPYSGQAPPPLPPPRTKAGTKPDKPPLLPPPSRTGVRTASASSSSASAAAAVAVATATATAASLSPPPPRLPGRPTLAPPKLPARSLSSTAPPLPPRGASPPPPPPPPPPLAPPIARSTRPIPTLSTESPPPPAPVTRTLSAPTPEQSSTGFSKAPIDWTNLSRKDKDALFRWLDEYFSRSLNITA